MSSVGWGFVLAWLAVVVIAYGYAVFGKKNRSADHRFVMVYGGGLMAAVIFWPGFIFIAYLTQN